MHWRIHTYVHILILGSLLFTMIAISMPGFQIEGSATNCDIGRQYSSRDTVGLDALAIFNSYDFNLSDNEVVRYSVSVVGPGQVRVFLVLGHDPTLFSDYMIDHSTESPQRSYSHTFANRQMYESNKYSIIVMADGSENITYEITIDIEPQSFVGLDFDPICLVFVISVVSIITVSVIIIAVRHRRGRTAPTVQYPYAPPAPVMMPRQFGPQPMHHTPPYRTDRTGPGTDTYRSPSQLGQPPFYDPEPAPTTSYQNRMDMDSAHGYGPRYYCTNCNTELVYYDATDEWYCHRCNESF